MWILNRGLDLLFVMMRLAYRLLDLLIWLWHPLEGAFTIICGLIHPAYAVLWFTGWFIYELDECWHLKDGAYKDIVEFMAGFAFGIVGYLVVLYGLPFFWR